MSSTAPGRGRERSDGARPVVGELSFAEHACLALVVEGISHGWAIGTLLAPGGELGRIWTLSRPLTYRAIDGLANKGLLVYDGRTRGQGRDRVLLAPTAAGRRSTRRWLDSPVRHLRDVRIGLLMKLALRQRAGLDTDLLLAAQEEAFGPIIEAQNAMSGESGLVELWRREHARAVRRFLDEARRPSQLDATRQSEMHHSARNQLHGTVTAVSHDETVSTVKAVLGDGQTMTAGITTDSVEDLDLASGDSVMMVIKSTQVMVAKLS